MLTPTMSAITPPKTTSRPMRVQSWVVKTEEASTDWNHRRSV